jgi:hypothetical protein
VVARVERHPFRTYFTHDSYYESDVVCEIEGYHDP